MPILPVHDEPRADSPEFVRVSVEALQNLADPWDRALQASLAADLLRTAAKVVFDVRREAVRELVEQRRVSRSKVAQHLGRTRACIHQILTSRRTSGARS